MKAVPYEFEKELVGLCLNVAKRMNAHVEVIGQRRAKMSGTTKGAPDAIVYCAGHMVPVEFKRFEDGRLNLDQIARIEDRTAQGVETYVVRTVQEFADVINACRRRR